MAHGKKRRGHRSSGVAAGVTGPASCLHSVHSHRLASGVETHPPNRHESASIWNRRRVLLLNSTYEPLTALSMRRAIVMVICGKADVVHEDPSGPVIHSATRSILVPSVIQLRSYVRVPYRPGRAHASGPVLLCLLRRQGRHRRPRGTPQPGRCPLLGELRCVLLAV